MNTFDIVFNEMQSNGVDCDIKKKDQYGNLVSVKKNELEALGTKSIIASTSKLLMKLNKREQLIWALETKDDGNQLFKRGLFSDAMSKYVEALAAADFGNDNKATTTKDDSRVDELNDEGESIHRYHHVTNSNVDELIIPVLCNLAACCIELKEWRKTISFSEQALILRPTCNKALLRKGIGYLNTGDYKLSLDCFTVVDEYIRRIVVGTTTATEEHVSKPFEEISLTDVNRLPHLMMQARRGIQRQRKQLLQQRSSLMKAFNHHHHHHQDDKDKDESIVNDNSDSHHSNIRSSISSEMDTLVASSVTVFDDDDDNDDHSDRTILSLRSSEKRHIDKKESRGGTDDLMSISELLIFLLQLLCDEVMSMLGWRRSRSSSSISTAVAAQ